MSALNLSEWALRNRSIVVYLMIVAVSGGIMSYFRLGRSEDPTFIIKTMVVQAAWPGATVEDTLKQVTERIERRLQETPKLDFLRSFTSAGRTTIFVNLQGDTTAREVPDIWYHVRKSVGDMAPTLPAGVVGPGFDDDFGDTFGIIYGFTSNMLIKPLDAVLIEFTNDAARLVVSTRRSDDGIGNLPRQGCEPSGGD